MLFPVQTLTLQSKTRGLVLKLPGAFQMDHWNSTVIKIWGTVRDTQLCLPTGQAIQRAQLDNWMPACNHTTTSRKINSLLLLHGEKQQGGVLTFSSADYRQHSAQSSAVRMMLKCECCPTLTLTARAVGHMGATKLFSNRCCITATARNSAPPV